MIRCNLSYAIPIYKRKTLYRYYIYENLYYTFVQTNLCVHIYFPKVKIEKLF